MALIALVQRAPLRRPQREGARWSPWASSAPSLFYGDGMITPAISVLSAVEGLKVVAPALESLVVPIALVVLTVLFAIQRFGTEAVGTPVRAGDGAVVHRPRRRRPRPGHPAPGDPAGALAASTDRVLPQRRRDRVPRARRGGARGHRRRGAVRRHGPLRLARDPPRLVLLSSSPLSPSTTSAKAR